MTATLNTDSSSGFDTASVASLLSEISSVQTELLEFLNEKRNRILSKDPSQIAQLDDRQQELCHKLEACQQRRTDLLAVAEESGLPGDSIGALTQALPANEARDLRKQVKESSDRMRLLRHQSLANWVVAQRSLLHVAQLLEIVATGGRIQPTYGKGSPVLTQGNLVDGEA